MSNKIYIGNLPYSINEDTLNDLFADFGTVESATVITDRATGRSKGFGFVEMSTEEEALNAIKQLNGKEVDGRPLTVNKAKPQAPRTGGPGGGGGRGRGGGGGGGGGRGRDRGRGRY